MWTLYGLLNLVPRDFSLATRLRLTCSSLKHNRPQHQIRIPRSDLVQKVIVKSIRKKLIQSRGKQQWNISLPSVVQLPHFVKRCFRKDRFHFRVVAYIHELYFHLEFKISRITLTFPSKEMQHKIYYY